MSVFKEIMLYIVGFTVAFAFIGGIFYLQDNWAFETTTIETLPDGRAWICYQKREQWKGAVSTHCVNWDDFYSTGVSRYEEGTTEPKEPLNYCPLEEGDEK